MTALNVSTQIPTNIVTLEQLALWANMTCNSIYNASQFQLAENQALQPVIQASHFNDAANQRRIGFINYLSVDPSYDFDKSKKLWMFANEFGTATIPTGFTTN